MACSFRVDIPSVDRDHQVVKAHLVKGVAHCIPASTQEHLEINQSRVAEPNAVAKDNIPEQSRRHPTDFDRECGKGLPRPP